jgi:hypothetical protein
MPVSRFRVTIALKGRQTIEELRGRLVSFRKVFDEIIERWVRHNRDKFDQSRGQELEGVSFDFGTIWRGVQPRYERRKRRAGFDDWLMVREGTLRDSLTHRDGFGWYEEVQDKSAAYGTILKTAGYHAETRPVIFLDRQDLTTIADMFRGWLEGGAPFDPFEQAEATRMDAEFRGVLDPLGLV